ncbi:general transcription factor II-I repeat domain-containing protein 2-like [Centruroides sculpturatus]|nr:general transcription factor II-I repeat domain-containing protein 2-like [Centruroides sculpturatus]
MSDENRMFQDEWEADYFVVQNKHGFATCLICRESVILKKYNIARHFNTKHKSFNDTFPPGSLIRHEKLAIFKKSLQNQQNIMSVAIVQDAAVTKASYEICYILGKHMKPFTDAEIVKECFLSASNVLFDKFSNKNQIISEIKKIQLSDSTCVRRIEDIANHICDNVIEDLKNCKFFSLAFDSSTDISATSQCSVFVRYCTVQNSICEDFLKFLPMKGQTRGKDYLDTICNFLEQNKIDVKKLICVCTDGCPSMTGSENGFISLLKQNYDLTNLITFHCIIHQENLASRIANPKVDTVMKTVINIVNYIRARELNHRKFKSLLEEVDSQYNDVLLHTSVRWLSRGKVLERFFSLRKEIMLFLQQNNKIYSELQNNEWWCIVAFLCDITEKLNSLNTGLQGKNKIISQMANKIFAFEEKLNIYYQEIQNKILRNFPTMTNAKQDGINISPENYTIFSNYLTALSEEFKHRFHDLRKIKNILLLIENPWHLEPAIISELADIFACNYAELFDEFIEMKNNTHLEAIFKEKRAENNYVDFWKVVPEQYKTVKKCAQILLTLFASTYLCETSYSKMKYAKNIYRNRLTDSHLDAVLRVACSSYKPDLNEIVKKCSQYQQSH